MVEIIGFIISLLALLYLFIKQNIPSQQKRNPPLDYQDEEEMDDPFKGFLKAMEKESAAREAIQHTPPPPPPRKKEYPKKEPSKKESSKKEHPRNLKEYQLTSSLKERRLKSSLEDHHIKSQFKHHEDLPGRTLSLSWDYRGERNKKLRGSRMQSTVRHLAQRKDLIIYQEIIGKPKSLRSESFPT